MTKHYDKGDVLHFNRTFVIFTRSCYIEYDKDYDRYLVTDHNISVCSMQLRNKEYRFEHTSGGMSSTHFVDGTLKPVDDSNARFFLNEFLRIKNTPSPANAENLTTLEMLYKIFIKNKLFANQVIIHEED